MSFKNLDKSGIIQLDLAFDHGSRSAPGGEGTCHVCIQGCACHVFGSEISLLKLANMNFPLLGG